MIPDARSPGDGSQRGGAGAGREEEANRGNSIVCIYISSSIVSGRAPSSRVGMPGVTEWLSFTGANARVVKAVRGTKERGFGGEGNNEKIFCCNGCED